jgi:hypothetical protein
MSVCESVSGRKNGSIGTYLDGIENDETSGVW